MSAKARPQQMRTDGGWVFDRHGRSHSLLWSIQVLTNPVQDLCGERPCLLRGKPGVGVELLVDSINESHQLGEESDRSIETGSCHSLGLCEPHIGPKGIPNVVGHRRMN